MGYFLFMNLLSLKLDHLIVFNEQYFFILFPLAAILFGVSYLSVSKLKGFHKHIQVLILTIILINSIVYGFLPPDMDTDRTYLHSRILSKLENNFESTPR